MTKRNKCKYTEAYDLRGQAGVGGEISHRLYSSGNSSSDFQEGQNKFSLGL